VASGEDAERAARAGANSLLLRMPGCTGRRVEIEAGMLRSAFDLPLLISDRVDVALAVGADGVNLPEAGLPPGAARRLLGRAVIGRSVHSLAGAKEAEQEGADFLLFGPVRASVSHPGAPAQGLDRLGTIARAVSIPVVAIGGLDLDSVSACVAQGARGLAAIGAFQQ